MLPAATKQYLKKKLLEFNAHTKSFVVLTSTLSLYQNKWPLKIPADNIQDEDEVIVFEVRHVCAKQIGLHFQLDILQKIKRIEIGYA